VVLRVENRDPRLAAGESYRIEVRRSIVPPNTDPADASHADPLESNWSFATAAPVGVVYDLTLVCPEARPDACPGGDHRRCGRQWRGASRGCGDEQRPCSWPSVESTCASSFAHL
jgi:hypothetical protein